MGFKRDMSSADSFAEKKAKVAVFNLTDDTFFRKITEDKGACEEMLQIILDKPDLEIIRNESQYQIHNIIDRSVILDLLCKDSEQNQFLVEMQKHDLGDDYEKRVRYYVSNLDTKNAEKGCIFKDLPDIYSVFISEFDIFKKGKTIYHINRVLNTGAFESSSYSEDGIRNQSEGLAGNMIYGEVRDNGVHEIYVNTVGKDDSVVSDLMKYFMDSNGYNPLFPRISERVQFYKEKPKGVDYMCDVLESYAAKAREEGMAAGRKEGIAAGRKEGIAAGRKEGIAEVLKTLSITPEEFEKICKDKKLQNLT